MKHIHLTLLSFLLLLAACYEDKGNYDYREIPVITISNVQNQYDLLRGVDDLDFRPTITSSIEGEIAADNPNYDFSCVLKTLGGYYFDDETQEHDMNPDKTKDFTYHFTEGVGTYQGIYSVKDKRTGVTTYHDFSVQLKSSVYEGWMVLCNEGPDNRVRLDMVSVISDDRIIPIHDILNASFPEQHNATQIMFDNSMTYGVPDFIYLMAETGSFHLDATELTATEIDNVAAGEFLADLGDDVPVRFSQAASCIPKSFTHVMTTKNGDVYINGMSGVGSSYEFPANSSAELSTGEYRVSPYIGAGMDRMNQPFNISSSSILFYDTDHQRFMGWDLNQATKLLYQLPESGATFIPFDTGQDLVYMQGTRYNKNTVFAILQAADGARSVLATNLTDDQYRQEAYYEDIQAENFNAARYFTFHSQYPYVFYGHQDKLYAYNLGTQALHSLNLPGEEITMVKIDLFKWLDPNMIPEEMREQEHYILVGSYKNGATDNNGGILRMYKFSNSTGKLEEVRKYEGFAKIVDVTYRERF